MNNKESLLRTDAWHWRGKVVWYFSVHVWVAGITETQTVSLSPFCPVTVTQGLIYSDTKQTLCNTAFVALSWILTYTSFLSLLTFIYTDSPIIHSLIFKRDPFI